ncbi:MAG: hypothetical protein OXH41_08435 [Chloroflexi bacterium]|nr:hypothetical protein [Chloroflexota bacterium]
MSKRQAQESLIRLMSFDLHLVAFGGGDMFGNEEYKGLRYYDFLSQRYPFSGGDPEQNGFHPCSHDPRGRTDAPFSIVICPPCWVDYTEWLNPKLAEAEQKLATRMGVEIPEPPAFLEGLVWGAVETDGMPDTRVYGREGI